MLVLRIFAGLWVVSMGSALLVFLITRDARWLRIAKASFKIGLVFVLIVLALYALERLVVRL